jgi:hypothetical protein
MFAVVTTGWDALVSIASLAFFGFVLWLVFHD